MEDSNKPVKRVGTFTMGLYLIIVGILAIYSTFQPNFDYMFVLKLTPIVFVLLGIEVLVYHFLLKANNIKYDIFSIFICFILICATICTAATPVVLSYIGPERDIAMSEAENTIYNICYEKLKDNKNIMSMNAKVYMNFNPLRDGSTITDNQMSTYLRIELLPTISSNSDLSKASEKILSELSELDINFENIVIESKGKKIRINDKFGMNLDAMTLENLISEN